MEKATIKYYLASPQGKDLTELFDFAHEGEIDVPDRVQRIYDLNKVYLCASGYENFGNLFQISLESIDNRINEIVNTNPDLAASLEDANFQEWFDSVMSDMNYGFYDEAENGENKFVIELKAKDKRKIARLIPETSLALYLMFPEWDAFPVLFNQQYYEFVERCGIMGITLPKIPLQRNPEERIHYYADVCECLANFRDEYELSNAQVCAILYGYAAEVREDSKPEAKHDLPSPTRIWLTGASKGDVKSGYVDKEESVWACNEQTKVGDIVVLYALSPYSKIHSVWRAVADGNVNPFDYYCNRAVVGQRILVPDVTFHDLKNDPEMSQVPIVRKDLMGINGVELSYHDYQNLLRMFQDKGMDISLLPNLEAPKVLDEDANIKLEQDVSDNILVPILTRLGYSDTKGEDWIPELKLKAGRDKETEEKGSIPRPDFTFFAKELGPGIYTAPLVIECKFDMANNNEFQSAFFQAVSYARLLNSDIMGVCDKHVLRLYKKNKNGNFHMDDALFDAKWTEINTNSEVFNKLVKLIGRDTIYKMTQR